MPEGPSIVIFTEAAAPFAGKRVMAVSGNSREEIQRMRGRTLRAVRSWGKHILLEFDRFSLRIHLLLFGSTRIDERREGATPRLSLAFARGRELNFYACSLKFIEGDLDAVYDWRVDVMSPHWDPRRARAALRQRPDVGAVIDFVRRERVVEAVAGDKHDFMAAQFAHHQRAARQAVGRAHDAAVGNVHFGQAGEAAAADNRYHGRCFREEGERSIVKDSTVAG